MTRSFGDTLGGPAGIICEPEIKEIYLNKNSKIVIIASDGIWEYLENSQVMEFLIPYYKNKDCNSAAQALIQYA